MTAHEWGGDVSRPDDPGGPGRNSVRVCSACGAAAEWMSGRMRGRVLLVGDAGAWTGAMRYRYLDGRLLDCPDTCEEYVALEACAEVHAA